jgi:hypothetical protein
MIGWIILGVYVIGFVPVFRRATWILAQNMAGGRAPDGEDWAMGMVAGFCMALCWPVVLLCYLLWQAQRNGVEFFKPPPHERAEIQARRIRELERELGLDR